MAEPALRLTDVDPREFIASVDHPVRRADAEILLELMEDVTGQPAAMWGPSVIGFGHYHYRYASGHEGDEYTMTVMHSPSPESVPTRKPRA
jgi:hypothetical protein